MKLLRLAAAATGLWLAAPAPASAQSSQAPRDATLLTIDARTQPAPPETGYLRMGTASTPDGQTLDINSRYATLDGAPWLPVAGEFHFPRVPSRYWAEELAKVKAAGVDIVTTYVFWNFHEKEPGDFDWTGDRDLRRFVTLAGEVGLKVLLRPGPWVHSEARFGGLPDWVVNAMPTRRSDPEYLRYVARYFDQVGAQVEGLLWKDGGPVIGVQIENEYGHVGEGGGPGHLLDLKRIAREAGLDVPMYTITGWGGSGVPEEGLIPMGGGYPDVPWGLSPGKSPPSGVYAFHYRGWAAAAGLAGDVADEAGEVEIPRSPYFTAEMGGGVPPMYRRRPILVPADVSAMLPVHLGSGVNWYGYYMFHGGQNSPDHDAMNETTAIGAYNDVPRIDYDFQAPLGAYGQEHAVMGKVRPFHFFLNAFGGDLAPMVVHRPDTVAGGPGDLATPRFSVRSLGDSGFLFFNNHVRQYATPVHEDVRFAVRLSGGTVTFPSTPVDIPTGSYFVWPIGRDLSGARLAWATAQPITRLDVGGTPVYVFFAQDGIPPELAFEAEGVVHVTAASGAVRRDGDGRYLVTGMRPGSNAVVTVTLASGPVGVLLLTQAQAESLTLPVLAGVRRLLLTSAQVFSDDGRLVLLSTGDPTFRLSVFPRLPGAPSGSLPVSEVARDGVFQVFEATASARDLSVAATRIRDAREVPPLVMGPPENTPHIPAPEVFGRSAAWSLQVHGDVAQDRDAFLRISARGDVARLFSGVTLLDDQFLSGAVWEIGLRTVADVLDEPLTLTILPMRADAPIYLEDGVESMVTGDQTAELTDVEVVPQYRLELETEVAGRM